jgi:putative transposase
MRMRIFKTKHDYVLFEKLLEESANATGVHVLAYCLMPNHWHLLVCPQETGALSVFMHTLTNAHTRRVHTATHTVGTGPLYQGRYKSFLIEGDSHLRTVLKYIERNPVRAHLVGRAEDWQWGSAWRRMHGNDTQLALLAPLGTPLPPNYRTWINTPEPAETLKAVRTSVVKGVPFGTTDWVERTVEAFGLAQTRRSVGRPKK